MASSSTTGGICHLKITLDIACVHDKVPTGLRQTVPDYIVDQIFPSYEIHLTGGASGSGKTTLEAQLIDDWRQGKPVFGYKSFPVPFCYIACDRSLQSIHATLRRIGVDHERWPIMSMIDSHTTFKSPLQIISAARKLVSDVRMIWLDGIHSLCPNINDYNEVQNFLTSVTHTCQDQKVTMKGLGHATKVREGEAFLNPRHRFLGSVAWGGYSDTMVIIDQERPQDPTDTTRNVYLLPRNAENQMLKYEFVDGRLSQITDATEFILDRWLNQYKAGDTVSYQNIVTAAEKSEVSISKARRWISKSLEAGRLLRSAHGMYLVSFPQ